MGTEQQAPMKVDGVDNLKEVSIQKSVFGKTLAQLKAEWSAGASGSTESKHV